MFYSTLVFLSRSPCFFTWFLRGLRSTLCESLSYHNYLIWEFIVFNFVTENQMDYLTRLATSPGLTRRLGVSVSYLRAPGLMIISQGCVSKVEYTQNYMQNVACILCTVGLMNQHILQLENQSVTSSVIHNIFNVISKK